MGPVEATAAGNILMQLVAAGEISSLAEGREIIRRSFELTAYVPEDADMWEEAYERFQGFRVSNIDLGFLSLDTCPAEYGAGSSPV